MSLNEIPLQVEIRDCGAICIFTRDCGDSIDWEVTLDSLEVQLVGTIG